MACQQPSIELSKKIKTFNYQTAKSRERTQREIAQLTILLAILNERFQFILSKPSKKSLGCLISPNIVSIVDEIGDTIDIDLIFKPRIEVQLKKGKLRLNPRNLKRVKRVTINNYLVDLANLGGIEVEAKSTKSGVQEQLDRIQSIFIANEKVEWNVIVEVANKLNLLLSQKLDDFVMSQNSLLKQESMTLETGWLYHKLIMILQSD